MCSVQPLLSTVRTEGVTQSIPVNTWDQTQDTRVCVESTWLSGVRLIATFLELFNWRGLILERLHWEFLRTPGDGFQGRESRQKWDLYLKVQVTSSWRNYTCTCVCTCMPSTYHSRIRKWGSISSGRNDRLNNSHSVPLQKGREKEKHQEYSNRIRHWWADSLKLYHILRDAFSSASLSHPCSACLPPSREKHNSS